MSIVVILSFLLLTGVAAYLQTVTGFAFGLVVMGIVGLTDLIPIPDAAIMVSVFSFVNAVQMLARHWRLVVFSQVALLMAASIPMIAVGFWLLEYFADTSISMLKVILGLAIVVSSFQLLRVPTIEKGQPGLLRTLFHGGLGGLMSGMFSTGGPPVVYHFYAQRLPAAAIRVSLVAIFAATGVIRMSLVLAAGTFPEPKLWPCFLAFFTVVAGTSIAQRFPPPIEPWVMRMIVVGLLVVSGISLAAAGAAVLL